MKANKAIWSKMRMNDIEAKQLLVKKAVTFKFFSKNLKTSPALINMALVAGLRINNTRFQIDRQRICVLGVLRGSVGRVYWPWRLRREFEHVSLRSRGFLPNSTFLSLKFK